MKCRKRFYENLTVATVVQAMVIYPPGADPAMPIHELTEAIVDSPAALTPGAMAAPI